MKEPARRVTGKLTELKPQWLHILLALVDGELHGLEIMKTVLDRTEGRIHLWPGALYGSLRELEEREWVEECDPPEEPRHGGGRARYFVITAEGRRVLSEEMRRLESLVDLGRQRNLFGSGR